MSDNKTVLTPAATKVVAADISKYVNTTAKRYEISFAISGPKDFNIVRDQGSDGELIMDAEGYRKFIGKVEEIAKKGTILDTDKVFFHKSSSYPRNNFNRYSEGAKRVQNIDKAQKVVISKLEELNFYNRNTDTLFYDQASDVAYSFDTRNCLEVMHGYIGTKTEKRVQDFCDSVDPALFSALKKSSSYWFNGYEMERTYGKKLLKKVPKISSLPKDNWGEPNFNYTPVPVRQLFDDLVDQIRPLEDYILDDTVNRYIDKNKPTLTPDQMENILPLLKGDVANVGIALKLLENMDLTNNAVEFKAMMMMAFLENEKRIKACNAWNFTGVKNLRKSQKIAALDGIYYLEPIQKIRKIGSLYTTVPDANKEKFKELTNPTVVKVIKDTCGVAVTNLLNIK